MAPTAYGSKPTGDGNLIVESDEYDEVATDPIAAKYLHPFVGARELLHREQRW
ncbi:type IIL restriction-modification enzyme MmeI [Corynebacterium anserum]|uniref:type IIL restriction-modification enzyme MmeI n=1 Tax=Corynebacterium anserum TaxID=2684406 RepID=UPI0028BED2CF|nr:type IIL restriction-modification enzyme MmeI [Corynebacterium anserum]